MRQVTAIFAMAALATTSSGFSAIAAPSAKSENEVLVRAQRATRTLNNLRAGLHSPDPSVRAATMNEMITSQNALLIIVAIDEGHLSDDPVLRDLSARAAFAELKGFVVEPDCDELLCRPAIVSEISAVAGFSPRVDKYAWKSGSFTTPDGQGQISGSQLTFSGRPCSGSFTATGGAWVYSGWIVCASGTRSIRMPMKVRIR